MRKFLEQIDSYIQKEVIKISRDRYKGGPTLSELKIDEALLAEKLAKWLFEKFLEESK